MLTNQQACIYVGLQVCIFTYKYTHAVLPPSSLALMLNVTIDLILMSLPLCLYMLCLLYSSTINAFVAKHRYHIFFCILSHVNRIVNRYWENSCGQPCSCNHSKGGVDSPKQMATSCNDKLLERRTKRPF